MARQCPQNNVAPGSSGGWDHVMGAAGTSCSLVLAVHAPV